MQLHRKPSAMGLKVSRSPSLHHCLGEALTIVISGMEHADLKKKIGVKVLNSCSDNFHVAKITSRFGGCVANIPHSDSSYIL